MSVIRHIFQCPGMSVVFVKSYFWPIEAAPMLGMKMFFGHCFIFGSHGTVCMRWVGLQVMAENMNIIFPYPCS